MIAYLTGTVLAHTKDGAIVKSGNLGYEIIGSWLGRQPVGAEVESWIYEYLENESVPRLVGCQTLEARNLFLQLLSVQGIGPKMASKIVDTLPPEKLVKAIQSGEVDTLTTVKGLGKKTAQKMVLELGKILVTATSSANADLIEALTSLKFTAREVETAIERTPLDGLTDSQQLAAVLKSLGGKS